jgi:hypothetical protein
MKKFAFLSVLFIVFGCSGSVKRASTELGAWKYSDLRAIDPADFANPNQDIIAVYSRDQEGAFQIRIDFLDQNPDDPPFLMIGFDNGLGGTTRLPLGLESKTRWDLLLLLPPDGNVLVLDSDFRAVINPKVTIFRDPILAAIIIGINKDVLDGLSLKTKVEFLSYNLTSTKFEVDELGPVILNALPPAPGSVIIAFWNTFHSHTPAQALRSWDGAHTGPFSSRHGLSSIINAAGETGIPVFLFDLNQPKARSAMDYLGVLPRLQKQKEQGTIILLDHGYSYTPDLIQLDEKTTQEFNTQIPEKIPSIAIRKRLLASAVNAGDTLLLGGDFSKTAWGNYDVAFQMLTYIKDHPWLKPLSDKSLLEVRETPFVDVTDPLISKIKLGLQNFPETHIKKVAKQLLSSLTMPGLPGEAKLRRQYVGQIGHLIAILEWSEDPQAITNCTMDLDWDGESECILATETLAAIIETKGGYISFAFEHHEGQFHQLIGPSFQLATGLSDPLSWNLDEGIAADPSVIPGAFANSSQKWRKFLPVSIEQGNLTLEDEEGIFQKTFTALTDGIQFQYKGNDGDKLLIPLVVDPWVMELPVWGNLYINEFTPRSWIWKVSEQITIEVDSSDPIDIQTFKDSFEIIRMPENPNYTYPAGHFLPFPLALGQITTGSEGIVNIKFSH